VVRVEQAEKGCVKKVRFEELSHLIFITCLGMKRLLPTSFVGWLLATLLFLAIAYMVFLFVLFPLLIPTKWGGATE
jgi:hypothetical protein